MNDHDRLQQLRALAVRIEGMPASAERDWMLGEVRARAVDVETGAEPAAMRALPADGAEAEIPVAPQAERGGATETASPPKPRRRPPSPRQAARATWGAQAARSRPAPVAPRRRAAHERVVDLLEEGGVLSLDDGRSWQP
jgi:uncharacterized membrane protein